MISAHPLTWPTMFPRAKSRQAGSFKTSLPAALKNVQNSIRLFGSDSGKRVEQLVISSNVSLGVDKPTDPGVAVWFVWDGMQVCIPVDRYNTVQSNLQAIHLIVEARRVELRHGTLSLVRASLQGFLALAAPAGPEWWDILECKRDASLDVIRQQYRRIAAQAHPDKPHGSTERMAAVNRAWEQAQEERR
jgi:hypothetical protein